MEQLSNSLIKQEKLSEMETVTAELKKASDQIAKTDEFIAQGQLEEGDGESLEILVNLAKDGEIDPWDVDLEMVTDKYLHALSSNKRESLKEAARGLFYASVLLRIKSEVLSSKIEEALNPHNPDDDLMDDFLDEIDDPAKQITFKDLEQALARKSIRKQRYRSITLNDLIGALKAAETEEEVREEKRRQRQLMLEEGYFIVEPEVSDDMLELTHAEDLEGSIEKARGFLLEYLIDGERINFEELFKYLGCWSNAFLASIFLSHDNEVDLRQEVFYGDLWLHEPESNN